jgi:hypothetical protein
MINFKKLPEFLDVELHNILRRRNQSDVKMDIAEQDIAYLIRVLLRFVDTDQFKVNFTSTPLFDFALKQRNMSSAQLQGLADFCLWRVGFFPFGFDQRHTPPRKNFVVAGKTAYLRLSNISHPALTFLSLGKNFLLFANLISELKLQGANDNDILQLWDFWEETGSQFAEGQLHKMNVVPVHLKKDM